MVDKTPDWLTSLRSPETPGVSLPEPQEAPGWLTGIRDAAPSVSTPAIVSEGVSTPNWLLAVKTAPAEDRLVADDEGASESWWETMGTYMLSRGDVKAARAVGGFAVDLMTSPFKASTWEGTGTTLKEGGKNALDFYKLVALETNPAVAFAGPGAMGYTPVFSMSADGMTQEWGKAIAPEVEKLKAEIREQQAVINAATPKDLPLGQQVGRGVILSAPYAALSMITLAATRNPVLSATVSAPLVMGESGATAVAEGKSTLTALRYGATAAAIESALSILPAKAMNDLITAVAARNGAQAGDTARAVLTEIGSEQLITLSNSLNEIAFEMEDRVTKAETVEEMLAIQGERQLVAGLIATISSSGVAGGVKALTPRRKETVEGEDEFRPDSFQGPLISEALLEARRKPPAEDVVEARAEVRVRDAEMDQALETVMGRPEDLSTLYEDGAEAAELSIAVPETKKAAKRILVNSQLWQGDKFLPATQVLAESETPAVRLADYSSWLTEAEAQMDALGLSPEEKAARSQELFVAFQDHGEFLTQATSIIEAWRKWFAPNQNIVLHTTPFKEVNSPADNHAAVAEDGTIVLSLGPADGSKTISAAERYHRLAHEMGHAVFESTLDKMGPKTREALAVEHQKFLRLLDNPDTKWGEVEKSWMGPIEYGRVGFKPDMTMLEISLMADESPAARNYLEWMRKPEEWLAQQVARHLTHDKKAQGVVRLVYADLAKRMSAFHKEHGNEFAPGMTTKEWLVSLADTNERAMLEQTERQRTKLAWDALDNLRPGELPPAMRPVARMREMQSRLKSWYDSYGHHLPPPSERFRALNLSPSASSAVDTGETNINAAKKYFWTFLQIAKENPHIPGLTLEAAPGVPGMVKSLFDFKSRVHFGMEGINKSLNEWKRLPRAQVGKVGELMLWARDASTELGMRVSDADVAIQARELGVNEAGLKMFNSLQNQIRDKTQEMIELMKARAKDSGEISRLEALGSRLYNLNYFPDARFGDHVVKIQAKEAGEFDGRWVEAGETIVREHYETAADAEYARKYWSKHRLGRENGVGIDKITNPGVKSFSGMPPELLTELKRRLPEDTHADIDAAMVAALPGKGFGKRLLQRKGVAGASRDYRRAYSMYMTSLERLLGRLAVEADVQTAINVVHDSANAILTDGGDARKRRAVEETMISVRDYMWNPGNEYTIFGAMAFTKFITGIPKHAFLAMYQLPLVSWPTLSKKYGSVEATAAMTRAVKQTYDKRYRPADVPEQLQAAYEQAEKDLVLSQTLGRDMAVMVQANALQNSMPRQLRKAIPSEHLSEAWNTFAELSAAMFHYSEVFSRHITFTAAWHMEMDRSGDTTQAYMAAKDAVEDGHYTFIAENSPRVMRGPQRPMFVFKQHMQGMLNTYMGHNPGKWRALAMLAFAAGLSGMPFMEDAEEVVDWAIKQHNQISGDYSTPPLSREILRDMFASMAESAGSDSSSLVADLILDGAGKYGFGLPWLEEQSGLPMGSFDVTGSITMGRMIPGVRAINREDWSDKFTAVSEDLAGVGIGVPLQMMQAITESEADGDWRLGKFLPNMLLNPMTAHGWAETGDVNDKWGRTIMHLDPENPRDMANMMWQSMGMPPTDVSLEREKRWAATKTVQYYGTARQYLMRQYFDAVENGDSVKEDAALAAIGKFNDTIPYSEFTINGQELVNSVRTRMTGQAHFELGLPVSKREQGVSMEVQDRFPSLRP